MDLIKVDPQLFIICRLCLDESGTYQLTPPVLQQIKYCYDIEINQFDGFPQLICEKCQNILSNYYTTKKTYIGKQNALRAKLEVRKEIEIETRALCTSPIHPTVSSTQDLETTRSSQKKRTIHSLSGEEGQDSTSSQNKKKRRKKPIKPPHTATWESNFNKHFVCKLCGKFCKLKHTIIAHLKVHSILISKHHRIFSRNCTVKLNKVDDHASLTGDESTIVHDSKIITQNVDNIYYYIMYLARNPPETGKSELISVTETYNSSPDEFDQTDSSDDDISLKTSNRGRRRLISRSSDGTIVLENQNKCGQKKANADLKEFENMNDDYITLEDSSDTDTGSTKNKCDLRSEPSIDTHIKATIADCRAIQNIIYLCQNKYLKKSESQSVETQLKHKILNIGTKVITSPSFVCTGILRFIENKNLEMNWKNNTITPTCSKELNYIRIMPKLREKHSQEKVEATWRSIPETEILHQKESVINSVIPERQTENESTKTLTAYTSVSSSAPTLANTLLEKKGVYSKDQTTIRGHKAVYNDCNSESDKKLLNANPVAHPRQLPKKHSTEKLKTEIVPMPQNEKVEQINESICLDDDEVEDTDLCMPIITSTTSLATPSIEQNIVKEGPANRANAAKIYNEALISNGAIITKQANFTNEAQVTNNSNMTNNKKVTDDIKVTNEEPGKESIQPVGRIKVKPVSELMSERVLNDLCHQKNSFLVNPATAQQGYQAHGYKQRVEPAQSQSVAMAPLPALAQQPVTSEIHSTKTSREYVILDTVQLPNTKTDSPIKYIQNLLQIHDIVLMQTKEKIPSEYVCLIKFKLQFEQETVNEPIIICLSLHCAGNKFILDVRDPTQAQNIDLNDLTANWQWEILKNFNTKQDVINKVTQNAQKINQDVYECTKRLISILSSINFKT